jgi:hypothetical protein
MIDMKSIKPIIEVTLEKGMTSRLTKKFKYEKMTPERETKFHPQEVTASIF